VACATSSQLVTEDYLRPNETSINASGLEADYFYDLSRPGRYRIQVEREVPKRIGSGVVKSNVITVDVTE